MNGFSRRYAIHLLVSMSLEDAKAVLGFPPSASPSPSEIQKAYRTKAIENHPDRGGDHRKMVEINVAKEILEGKRKQDRTPYTKPQKSPEEAEREKRDEKLRKDLRTLLEEEGDVSGYLNFALARSAPDLVRGGTLIVIKDFLTDGYADALNQISDDIDRSPLKSTPDWQKADKICQSLANKALRLGSKFAALHKKRAAVSRAAASEGVTLNEVRDLVQDTAKFIADWQELRAESGRFMALIHTSESVPLFWDDTYAKSHHIITAFHDGFKSVSSSDFDDFEKQLKDSLKTVSKILEEYGEKAPSEKDWRTPGDYQWAMKVLRRQAGN